MLRTAEPELRVRQVRHRAELQLGVLGTAVRAVLAAREAQAPEPLVVLMRRRVRQPAGQGSDQWDSTW